MHSGFYYIVIIVFMRMYPGETFRMAPIVLKD